MVHLPVIPTGWFTGGLRKIGVWWGYPLGPNGKYSVRGVSVYEKENERENETELQLTRAASQIFFFFFFYFFFFFLCAGPCPRPLGKFSVKKTWKKNFSALRAPCPRLRFTRKAKPVARLFLLFARACAYAWGSQGKQGKVFLSVCARE